MGCASSKNQNQNRCSHCENPSSSSSPRVPVRSYSMHVHHPPQSKGDTYHLVALTSTTLGFLDPLSSNHNKIAAAAGNGFLKEFKTTGFVEDNKDWSNLIEDEKLPIRPPPQPRRDSNNSANRTTENWPEPSQEPPFEAINTWELMEGLEDTTTTTTTNDVDGGFCFEEKEKISVKEKVVFYFTSLRGVRKTYEDCCNVRQILKGLGVKMDERDVSMHSGFKEELKELEGGKKGGSGKWLPVVFVGGNCLGGAEEIRRLHENGKLEKLLQCCEKIGGGDQVCESCGDIRFVPCETCSGSCKLYYEGYDRDHDDEQAEEEEDGGCGFQRCPDCNENGLIRCPVCC